MGRSLFLPHYLPASIFGYMTVGALIDFLYVYLLANSVQEKEGTTIKDDKIIYRAQVPPYLYMVVACLCAFTIAVFLYFAPIIYGLKLSSHEALLGRKWLPSWDLQFTGN